MFSKAITVAAMALMSVGAHAAGTDLAVEVTIAPEGCAIALGLGGSASYGTLSQGTVKAYPVVGDAYWLPLRSIPLDVTCPAPTGVALTVTDNRAASRPSTLASPEMRFGLGWFTVGSSGQNRPVGSYSILTKDLALFTTPTGASRPAAVTLVRAKGAGTGNWRVATNSAAKGFLTQNEAIGYAGDSSGTAPVAILRLKGTLVVNTFVIKSLADSAASSISLDGSLTMGLEYI